MTFDKELYSKLIAVFNKALSSADVDAEWKALFSQVTAENFSDIAGGVVVLDPSLDLFAEKCVLSIIAMSLSPEPFVDKFFDSLCVDLVSLDELGGSIRDYASIMQRLSRVPPRNVKDVERCVGKDVLVYVISTRPFVRHYELNVKRPNVRDFML